MVLVNGYFSLLIYMFLVNVFVAQDTNFREPFIRYGPEDADVSKGDQVRLQCYVYGKPTPEVTWYKDGVVLTENESEGRTVAIDKSLVIQKAQRNSKHDDSGVYYCLAKNQLGSQRSNNATLNVKYLSKIFLENPSNSTSSIHGTLRIKCKPPRGFPKPTIEWLHNGQPLVENNFDIDINDANGVSEVRFNGIQWSSRGEYVCVAKNSEGERKSKPATVTLNVIVPNLVRTDEVIKVYEGKSATLQCYNSFQPEPKRTWTKIGGKMPPSSRVKYQDESAMIINNVKFADNGEYQCAAVNAAGKSSVTYQLIIYKPMSFEVLPIDMSVGKGQKAKFDCMVTGGINTQIVWSFGGDSYDTKSTGRISMDTKNSLVVTKVEQSDDTKKLSCIAEDDKSRKYSKEIRLTVIKDTTDPPPLITTLPSVSEVEGGKLVLPCTAKGTGTLTFQWFFAKNNKLVPLNADGVWLTVSAFSANLTMNSLFTSDTATYRCQVKGASGTSSKLTVMTIRASDGDTPPKVPNVKVPRKSATTVTLTWSRPPTSFLSPVTLYLITAKKTTTGETWKITVDGGDQTEWKISSLSPSTLYSFSIVAVNRKGPGKVTFFPDIETYTANPTVDPNVKNDRLENVNLKITTGDVTSETIEVKWNPVESHRITGYIIFYRVSGITKFVEKDVRSNTATNFMLRGLKPNTKYELEMKAVSHSYQSKRSPQLKVTTQLKIIIAVQNVRVTKHNKNTMTVSWDFPPNIKETPGVNGATVLVEYSSPRKVFQEEVVQLTTPVKVFYNLDPDKRYYVSVAITTQSGTMKRSEEVNFRLSDMKLNEVVRAIVPTSLPDNEKKDDGGFLAIVKEPWFIATIGVLVWLLLLAIVVLICCRRKKKHAFRDPGIYESRGLLPPGRGTLDYPNTSLNRSRVHDSHPDQHLMAPGKRKMRGCCRGSQSSSIGDDFPNRAEIKPLSGYTRHDNIEMRQKAGSLDPMKENNVGIALRNGYMVDAPLNNELGYRQNSIENRMYNAAERARMPPAVGMGGYRELSAPAPGSGSMSRRQNDQRVKQDSVDRRLGEIVRTNKQVSDANVNVMDTNPQASWKREPKPKGSPNVNNVKPPGENTLRRQGKFKPLPKLEVLNWADGVPNSSKAPSTTDGSPPGSPKTTASAFSEVDNIRADSRMESHGGSSNSLNKYPYEKRRRRNSNASSMMSSELYQSEMDPSGYSDVVSDRKKRKEKSIPPPIDFDGLTSDILLQWAESVTNSSPSSSGSSSPSRLSGISSEGSLYTDEDFAQAVAAVAECGGFNMDYDYNLPGMNVAHPPAIPLSSTRNTKMDKIDQVFAQRAKPRNSPAVPGAKVGSRPDQQTSQGFVPQISMSGYLTGSQKGPQSTHSSSSGLPRSTRQKNDKSERNNARYGTGFDAVDSAKPLTVTNLMKHDSSLDRVKKESAKPLTVSNLRHHETSLDRDRDRRQKPPAYETHKPPPYESIEQNGYSDANALSKSSPVLLPEAALSVTSALERHESMNSNSKDSVNSSNRHDSEVENNSGTSERRQQRRGKKHYVNNRDPQSSTSTISTVRTSPDNDETDC